MDSLIRVDPNPRCIGSVTIGPPDSRQRQAQSIGVEVPRQAHVSRHHRECAVLDGVGRQLVQDQPQRPGRLHWDQHLVAIDRGALALAAEGRE